MTLNHLLIPPEIFPDRSTGRRTETMTSNLLFGVVAQRTQRTVDRVLAHVARRLGALGYTTKNWPLQLDVFSISHVAINPDLTSRTNAKV